MRILKLADVESKTGQKKTFIYDAVAAGRFPQPVRLPGAKRAIGWVEHEIDEFIAAAIRERDARRKNVREPAMADA